MTWQSRSTGCKMRSNLRPPSVVGWPERHERCYLYRRKTKFRLVKRYIGAKLPQDFQHHQCTDQFYVVV